MVGVILPMTTVDLPPKKKSATTQKQIVTCFVALLLVRKSKVIPFFSKRGNQAHVKKNAGD